MNYSDLYGFVSVFCFDDVLAQNSLVFDLCDIDNSRYTSKEECRVILNHTIGNPMHLRE